MKSDKQYVEKASYTWSEDSIRMILTPSQKAKSLYLYIQEVGYFKTESPYFTERQNLNSFLIIYTISGKGKLFYEGKEWELSAGSVAYIDCIRSHRYEAVDGENWEFLWVHLNGSNGMGYYLEFAKDEFQILETVDGEQMKQYFWELIHLNQRKNITTEVKSNTILHTMIGELILQNSIPDVDGSFIPQFVKDICKEIEIHFKEEIGLEDLAKQVNRSKYHVAKEFKKYIGTTVNEYIIIARISYAKELLRYSDATVHDITYTIGMNNVSHFINLFKQREHMTPLSYRNEWR